MSIPHVCCRCCCVVCLVLVKNDGGGSIDCLQYVRREIRQLTDKDRETFFDTMETLYRLPTAEGNNRYGDDYKVR